MRHKVVAVAYDRLCTFELGCVVELFALPRPELAVPWYEFAVCSAAGLDMLMHLVRRDHGAKIANQVAQRLVIPPHRDGGQAQFVPRPLEADERGRLAHLMDYIRAHLAAPHTTGSLARRAAMSPR